MTIREYRHGDFEGVMNLWLETGLGRPERGDDEAVVELTLKMGGFMLVMTDDESGRIAGTSWVTFDGRRLMLHHFGILPEFQKRGLSNELLHETLAYVKARGIQVKLEVNRKNTVAINLYKKAGFEYLGDYDVYIVRDTGKL